MKHSFQSMWKGQGNNLNEKGKCGSKSRNVMNLPYTHPHTPFLRDNICTVPEK